jgi:hypothetical protein
VDPEGPEPVYLELADALELYAAIVGGTTARGRRISFVTVRASRARSAGHATTRSTRTPTWRVRQLRALTGSQRAKRSSMATSASC